MQKLSLLLSVLLAGVVHAEQKKPATSADAIPPSVPAEESSAVPQTNTAIQLEDATIHLPSDGLKKTAATQPSADGEETPEPATKEEQQATYALQPTLVKAANRQIPLDIFQLLDANADNQLSLPELSDRAALSSAFPSLDTNHNGLLDRTEFAQILIHSKQTAAVFGVTSMRALAL